MPLNITKANQEELLETARQLTESEGWKRDAVAFAVRRDGGEIICIGVFQDFAGREAEWHGAMIGEKLSPEVIQAMVALAFNPRFLNLKRVYAPVAESNRAAQIVALKCGYDFEYRKRGGAAGGEDAIVFSITPESAGKAAAIGPNRNAA